MNRLARVVLLVLFVFGIFSQIAIRDAQAQSSMLALRVTPIYMQVNQPSSGFNHSLTVPRTPLGADRFGNPYYYPIRTVEQVNEANRQAVQPFFDRINHVASLRYSEPQNQRRGVMGAFRSLRCALFFCRPAAVGTVGRWVQTQQTDASVEFTDEVSGNRITIDPYGQFVVTSSTGEELLDFALRSNYFGEPLVEVQGDDGAIYRESFDGHTLEIDPDGENCIMSDGTEEYPLELDENGDLVYYGPDGEVLALYQDEDGTLLTADSDGYFGEFYEGGDFAIFDEDDNVLEEGEIKNPDLDERSEELGYDLFADPEIFGDLEGDAEVVEAIRDALEDDDDSAAEGDDGTGDDSGTGEDDDGSVDDGTGDSSSDDGSADDGAGEGEDASTDDDSVGDGAEGEDESADDGAADDGAEGESSDGG